MKKIFIILTLLLLFAPVGINFETENILQVQQASALITIGECDYIYSMGTCVANGILSIYELTIFYTTQVLLVVIGLMFDAFLFFSLNSNFYRSGIIEAGWEILRDFTNIIFIFALLTIAFKLVLNQDDGKTKSTLIKTILIALTINFSLFITYAIIDSSNILAQVFYNRIDTTGAYNVDNTSPDGGPEAASPITTWVADLTDGQKSVSLAIASKINPQQIIQQSGVDNFIQGFIIVTSAGVMNILMGYIFITLMLLFLGRSLVLMISGIIAPIAFASLTVPAMQGLPYVGFTTWLKELVKLAFMAPVFMFFMYVIVTFLGNDGFLASLSNVQGQGFLVVIMSTYMFFMIIGGLLLVAKKITTSMAGDLGGMAAKGVAGMTSALVAGAAVAATGGAAAAGGLMRGVGAVGKFAGSKAGDNRLGRGLTAAGKASSGLGKAAMAFKTDVTKIPGFNKLAEQSGLGGLGNMLGKASNISYGDADVAVRAGAKNTLVGANKLRKGISNAVTGKETDAVKKWDDQLQESRDELTKTRIENAQRKAMQNAEIPADSIKTDYDRTTGTFTQNTTSANIQDMLKQKQAQLARMDSSDKKAEADKIKRDKAPLEANLEFVNQQIKGESNPATRKRLKDEAVKIKKDLDDIENTSTEGVIKQLKKAGDRAKNDARAKMLKKDVSSRFTQQDSSLTFGTSNGESRRKKRVDTQASRVGGGEIDTSPTPTSKTDDKK